MPRIIISTLKPSHFRPTVTIGSGVASFQLGQMSLVASRNFAAIWLSTWPLKGMPFGRITSNADILSVATITIRSSLMLYTRSEEHTSELQSRQYLVCRLLLEKKKKYMTRRVYLSSHTS